MSKPVVAHKDDVVKADLHHREDGLEAAMNSITEKDSSLAMGTERRIMIEKKLKLKLDLRFSILVSFVALHVWPFGRSGLSSADKSVLVRCECDRKT